MSYSVPRSLVEAFYKAYASRDHDTVADFLDDDALIDSFDAVQQVLGHPLTTSARVSAGEGELVAV